VNYMVIFCGSNITIVLAATRLTLNSATSNVTLIEILTVFLFLSVGDVGHGFVSQNVH